MATFKQYDTKNGKRWLFKAHLGINPATGKRVQVTKQGFKTKAEAQKEARKLETSASEGNYTQTNLLTYEEVYKQWFENHSKVVKISTRKSIESKFKKHILPRFGRLKIQDITRVYCQKQINEIAAEIKSVHDIKIQANLVFKYALKMEIISKNPLEFVTVPKHQEEFLKQTTEEEERNYWTKGEVLRFLSIAERELTLRDHTLFRTLIFTGARKGEILALTWDDVDFNTSTLTLNKTLCKHDGQTFIQTSKTKKSRRKISLDPDTVTLLKKLRIQQKEEYLMARKYIADDDNTFFDNIFTRDDYTAMRLAYPNEKLDILIKSYDLHRITIHGLRHTHASLLFEAGANPKEVQERLGHSDIKMTMDIYTHVTNTVKEKTAQKFLNFMES